jgi:membrane associated rhomboid family serine protease
MDFVPFMNLGIIVLTVIISISAFSSQKIMDDLIFYPPAVQRGQWYRFFTCGFIHADFFHLAFNMYALYLFGGVVEYRFYENFPGFGKWLYLLLYVASLFFCLLPTYNKNRNNHSYRSLGASGAVSAVIFAGILFDPTRKMGVIFLPFYLPGFVFGPLYLLISSYLDKRGGGNINHSAHIWGALFGIVFVVIASYIAGAHIFGDFIYQIKHSLER